MKSHTFEVMKVRELAGVLNGTAEGDQDLDLFHFAALEDATAADLSFVTSRKALKAAQGSHAGCLLVPLDFANDAGRTIIRTGDPRAAAARAIVKLHPPKTSSPGVHPTAIIGPGTIVEPGARSDLMFRSARADALAPNRSSAREPSSAIMFCSARLRFCIPASPFTTTSRSAPIASCTPAA
jgi:hypothetical protein